MITREKPVALLTDHKHVPVPTHCETCDRRLLPEERLVCDPCWYGMRLDPEGWMESMDRRGIKVERSDKPSVLLGEDGRVVAHVNLAMPYVRVEEK